MDIPTELLGNSDFREFITNILKSSIINVNNQIKFGELDVDDELVKATMLVIFNEELSFEFLRTINLAMNGADETAFGNVNEFLNKIEELYFEGKSSKDAKIFGGN